MKQQDNPKLGIFIGLLLPLLGLGLFSATMIGRFESFQQMVDHFLFYKVWYKVLSLSLMPGAGLFFLWSKSGKINQARSVLLMTMFYGIFVLILYFS